MFVGSISGTASSSVRELPVVRVGKSCLTAAIFNPTAVLYGRNGGSFIISVTGSGSICIQAWGAKTVSFKRVRHRSHDLSISWPRPRFWHVTSNRIW